MKNKSRCASKNLLIVFICIWMIACGGKGANNNGTSDRALGESVTEADLSNDACRAARKASAEQPLEAYVAALTTLADNGSACAQYGLATLYKTGYENVVKNEPLSQHYLSLAVEQKYLGALRLLERL